jgi:hypothetical protein
MNDVEPFPTHGLPPNPTGVFLHHPVKSTKRGRGGTVHYQTIVFSVSMSQFGKKTNAELHNRSAAGSAFNWTIHKSVRSSKPTNTGFPAYMLNSSLQIEYRDGNTMVPVASMQVAAGHFNGQDLDLYINLHEDGLVPANSHHDMSHLRALKINFFDCQWSA